MSELKLSGGGVIAIVGCGPSGIAVYAELIRRFHAYLKQIFLFDGNGVMSGCAFNSLQESSLTNTSVGVTSLSAVDDLEFFKWLQLKYPSKNYQPTSFVPRKLVREYAVDTLNNAQKYANSFGCKTSIIYKHIVTMDCVGAGKILTDIDGCIYQADAVIFATGVQNFNLHPELNANSQYIQSPYPEQNVLNKVSADSNILILGSKLSAIDVAIACSEHHPTARICMVSPSGQLPSVRDKLLYKPLTRFNIEHLAGYPRRQLLRRSVQMALLELRPHGRYLFSDINQNAQEKLNDEIVQCQQAKNTWQEIIAGMIDNANEIWGEMSPEQKVRFKTKVKYFTSPYISAFPVQNAQKILLLMKQKRLTVLPMSSKNSVKLVGGVFHGQGALSGQLFDVVVNATGVKPRPLPYKIYEILVKNGAHCNADGTVTANANSMSIQFNTSLKHIYVIGAPAFGSLLVVNYIRTSVISAKKIVDNLSELIVHRETTIGNKTMEFVC